MMGIVGMDKIEKDVSAIGHKYGVAKVYLFGSYARQNALENSDIDLRIEKGRIRGLFQLSGFQQELEETLGRSVDLVTSDSLDDAFLDAISAEEVLIYEDK